MEYVAIGAGMQCVTNLVPSLDWLGCRLLAVVDPDIGNASRLSLSRSIPAIATLDELLSTDISGDFALVANPIEDHVGTVAALISAGWNVFVEKPLATSANDSRQLQRLAQENDRVLWVGHNRRYAPAYRKLASHWRKSNEAPLFARLSMRVASESSVHHLWNDIGVHGIDVLTHFFGQVLEVSVRSVSESNATCWTVFLRHENGYCSDFYLYSAGDWSTAFERFELAWASKHWEVDSMTQVTQLNSSERIWSADFNGELPTGLSRGVANRSGLNPGLSHSSHAISGWFYSLNAFLRSLRLPALASPELAQSVEIVKITEAILLSHREGRTVKMRHG